MISILSNNLCSHRMLYTVRFCSMASLASLGTLTDGVLMVARSWTNMSEIPEHELDEQIRALKLNLASRLLTYIMMHVSTSI